MKQCDEVQEEDEKGREEIRKRERGNDIIELYSVRK